MHSLSTCTVARNPEITMLQENECSRHCSEKHPADSYLLTLSHTLLYTSSNALDAIMGDRGYSTEIGDLDLLLSPCCQSEQDPRPGLCLRSVQTVTCNLKKGERASTNERASFSKILTTGRQAKATAHLCYSTSHGRLDPRRLGI